MPSDGLYGKNFGQSAAPVATKPECYSNPSQYSDEDSTCRVCPVKGSCRYHVEQKLNAISRGYVTAPTAAVPTYAPPIATTGTPTAQVIRPTYSTQQPPYAQQVYAPPPDASRLAVQDGDTFMGALAQNGFLSAVEAVLQEAVFGVRSIPRRRYPNPFQR